MRAWVRALRVLHIVAGPHPLVAGGLAMAAIVAMAAVAIRPDRAAVLAIPMLLLQMLGSSSGFAPAARRGHYDLLLTIGPGRSRLALAHWCASTWPGVAAWLAIVAVESLMAPGSRLFLNHVAVAAWVLASTLPWAVNVPFRRLTAGLTLVVALVSMVAVVSPDWQELWVSGIQRAGYEVSVPAAVIGALAMCLAVSYIDRMDVALEAAQ